MKPKQSRRWCAGGDYALTNTSTTSPALQPEAETTVALLDNWFDAIEVGLRERVRDFIQAMIESELDTFGQVEIAVSARQRGGQDNRVEEGWIGCREDFRNQLWSSSVGSTLSLDR